MTDVFLWPGEANPNDVKLRDPTTTGGAAIVTVSATLSAAAVLVGAVLLIIPATATVSAAGSLTAAAIVEVHAGATLSEAGSLAGSTIVEVHAAASLTEVASLVAASLVEIHAGATLSETGTLTAVAEADGEEPDDDEPDVVIWGPRHPEHLRWALPRPVPRPKIIDVAAMLHARAALSAACVVVPGTEAPLVLALFMLMED